MIITIKMRIILILITALIFMGGIAISQIRQKKGSGTIFLSQVKVVVAMGLSLIGLTFLDSYHYLMSTLIGNLLQLTPIYVNPTIFESFLLEKWFVILSVVLMAWLINIIFVYYTKWRYLFVTPTGAIMMSLILLFFMQYSKLTFSTILIISTILIGLAMSFGPYFTIKIGRGELEKETTIGGFNYLNIWICLGFSKLFGACETKTGDVIGRVKQPFLIKNPWKFLIISMTGISVLLLAIASMRGYDNQIRLIVFDQFIIEGVGLEGFNLLSLWLGIGCFYGVYRIVLRVYPDYLLFFKMLLPQAYFATDWIYQFKNTEKIAVVGFFCSYTSAFITLMYFSFYQWDQVVIPNLLIVGGIGILVAKLAEDINGIKGTIMASFMNGILLTAIPTLSFHWFQMLQIDASVGSLDFFFIAQLLDILFIF